MRTDRHELTQTDAQQPAVCIDKSSSQELSTALNSMFKYYQNATCCYTFLDDVVKSGGVGKSTFNAGEASEWFSRGWYAC